MRQEQRTIQADEALGLELYQFKGIKQNFATHFHEYYVVGSIEDGERQFVCNGTEYVLKAGESMLINPFDNHSCAQIREGAPLHFFSFNIGISSMRRVIRELTGREELPYLNVNVLRDPQWYATLQTLKELVERDAPKADKMKTFMPLMRQLVSDYSQPLSLTVKPEVKNEIRTVCQHIERNYQRNITLDELSALVGLSKYYLLRSFTKEMGISPYRYLENIRIERARQMLAQGALPAEVALGTGFSDQSHFTNFFKNIIGLTPRVYRDTFR